MQYLLHFYVLQVAITATIIVIDSYGIFKHYKSEKVMQDLFLIFVPVVNTLFIYNYIIALINKIEKD